MVRLLVTAGSERRGSLNRRLANVAAGVARSAGVEVTDLDLRALALPLYDGDVEAAGMPASALRLRDLFAAHDAVLMAAPEYNGFVTPLIVNSMAWVSRTPDGLKATGGTVAGLVSASPGYYGGARALLALRSFLSMNLGMLVVPQTHSIPAATQAFDERGALVDPKQQAGIERVVQAVLRTAGALEASR
jgi:NAD(P)H-dependent FMN reductase